MATASARSRRSVMRPACLAVSAFLIAAPAGADGWNLYGDVSLSSEYGDNQRQEIINPDEGFRNIANLGLNAEKVGRRDELRVETNFEAVRFDGVELLNNEENVEVRVSGEHKPSRSFVVGWYGEFAQDTTSNRQPRVGAAVDENSGFNADTALTREQFRTTEYSVGPNASWQVSKKLNLSAAYSFRDVSFPDRATDEFNFFDFEQHRVSLRGDYELNQRHSISLLARAGQFESSQRFDDGAMNLVVSDVDTDTLGASLGYRFDVSEIFYVGASAGVENLEVSTGFSDFDSDETEFVYRIFAVSRGQNNSLFASYGRSVQASGVGRLLESNLARAIYTHRLSPRGRLRLRASYLENKSIGIAPGILDRDFLTLEASYGYDLTRQFRAGLSYRYRSREQRIEGSRSDSNAIAANIRYEFGRQ